MASNKTVQWLVALFCCLLPVSVLAQRDSLVLKNGDVIVGQLKMLDDGVATIETDYSKNDFQIEWSGITAIYSQTHFLIVLKDGRRMNGELHSIAAPKAVMIITLQKDTVHTTLSEIVFLKGGKFNFLSHASASIDLGLSLTKANNLRQYNSRTTLGYRANKWEVLAFYSDLRSKQDSIAPTKRTEFAMTFRYFLPKDWFLNFTPDLLSNTEQAIQLRTTARTGAGKFFARSDKLYCALGAGLSFNNETFSNETPSRKSLEAYTGMELNLFGLNDFSMVSSVYVYPSLTEARRWRTDFSLDTKYDLPLNFYIRIGGTINYDNQPAVTGRELDYIVTLSVGWELK
ncbi:DUF481 domain-containing protein [Taibaiella soli]|uniref:DUF481 domain-containing protein n=1 Tax=Taibaiella soli TaxID=1649169 RepID=A0A2W2AHA5_9BACT|nr:DUF481 domain-containing protein [Taibaiella soli]PZF74875.1 hypothetical protein DN068_01375 [Taibaiella soli]